MSFFHLTMYGVFIGIASFQPKSKGTYHVVVTQDGKDIAGSPFAINIDDRHVCSAHKVKVTGAVKDAVANKVNDIGINIADAGWMITHDNLNLMVTQMVRMRRTLSTEFPCSKFEYCCPLYSREIQLFFIVYYLGVFFKWTLSPYVLSLCIYTYIACFSVNLSVLLVVCLSFWLPV